MACMCGDLCCSSCGPAQGNHRCPVCRAWASEGCDCTEEAKDKAERANAEADRLACEQFAEMLQLEKDHAAEIAAAIRSR